MAKIAGKAVSIEPLSREEHFYDDIAGKIEELSEGGGSGGGGVLVVLTERSQDTGLLTCDKTAAEMFDAYGAGGVVLFSDGGDGAGTYMSVLSAEHYSVPSPHYTFTVYDPSLYANADYSATSGDDFPEHHEDDPM